MAKTRGDVPLEHALKRTNTKRKLWRDLVEARLVDPAIRPPTGKSYVISREQYERLKRIKAARKRIDGRFTLGKLAFELAEEGDRSIPLGLLRSELLKRVDGFFGLAKRGLQRFCGLSPEPRRVSSSGVYAAAKRISIRFTKHLPILKRVPAFTACYLVSSIVLRMMYLKTASPLEHVRGIKELIMRHMTVEHPTKGHVGFSFGKAMELATTIATMLSDVRSIITLDASSNILGKSVSAVDEQSFWQAFEAEKLVNRAMWDFIAELKQDIRLPHFDAKERSTFHALFLASLIAHQRESPQSEILKELLTGSDRKFRETLGQLLATIRNVIKLQPVLDAVRRR